MPSLALVLALAALAAAAPPPLRVAQARRLELRGAPRRPPASATEKGQGAGPPPAEPPVRSAGAAPVPAASPPAADEGALLTEQKCGKCHHVSIAFASELDGAGWKLHMKRMNSRPGAAITEDQARQIHGWLKARSATVPAP